MYSFRFLFAFAVHPFAKFRISNESEKPTAARLGQSQSQIHFSLRGVEGGGEMGDTAHARPIYGLEPGSSTGSSLFGCQIAFDIFT